MNCAAHAGRSLHHVSYVVEDLRAAAHLWSSTFGAGPFFILEHIQFDSVYTTERDEAIFDHSFAFGQWGAGAIELQQIHEISPPRLAAALGGLGFRHIAYVCDEPAQESEKLERAGMPMLMRVRVDAADVEATFHDAPYLGHCIELHKRSEALDEVHGALAQAAVGWDGHDPIRAWPPPIQQGE